MSDSDVSNSSMEEEIHVPRGLKNPGQRYAEAHVERKAEYLPQAVLPCVLHNKIKEHLLPTLAHFRPTPHTTDARMHVSYRESFYFYGTEGTAAYT